MKNATEKGGLMSIEMIKKIKADCPINLVGVKAQKKDGTVLMYPNEFLNQYTKDFVSKYCSDVDDEFIFEKYSVQITSDEKGHKYKTGWFCPRSFWDNVFRQISKAKF